MGESCPFCDSQESRTGAQNVTANALSDCCPAANCLAPVRHVTGIFDLSDNDTGRHVELRQ
jgi:hypothetical protein